MSLELAQQLNNVTALLLLLVALALIIILGLCVLIYTTWAIGNRQNRSEPVNCRSP